MTLQPGDILLWRVDPGANLLDRFVGWGESFLHQKTPQGYQYYHVAFVSMDIRRMYSSQPPKINLYDIPDPLPDNIEVWRLKNPAAASWPGIFRYANSRCGRVYPFLGVLTAGWLSGNLEFCSQFTEDSFACGQVVLSQSIRFTSPDDIASSALLTPAA